MWNMNMNCTIKLFVRHGLTSFGTAGGLLKCENCFQVFQSEQSIEVKVHLLADRYIEFLKNNPDLPYFVLGELQRRPERLLEKVGLKFAANIDLISEQLKAEASMGKIRPIEPQHFMAHLISMIVFPFVARPLFMKIFKLDSDDYFDYLDQRKREIPVFMMAALRP